MVVHIVATKDVQQLLVPCTLVQIIIDALFQMVIRVTIAFVKAHLNHSLHHRPHPPSIHQQAGIHPLVLVGSRRVVVHHGVQENLTKIVIAMLLWEDLVLVIVNVVMIPLLHKLVVITVHLLVLMHVFRPVTLYQSLIKMMKRHVV
jgi:hypothetical protein